MASNQSTPQNAPSNNVAASQNMMGDYNKKRLRNTNQNVVQEAAQKQKAQTLASQQSRIAGAEIGRAHV